jgi:hypothetical protein
MMVTKNLLLPAMFDIKHKEGTQQKSVQDKLLEYDGVDLDDDGGDKAEKVLEQRV